MLELSEEQKKACLLMAHALYALSLAWTDEFGEMLSNAMLLPLRDLCEGAAEYSELSGEE